MDSGGQACGGAADASGGGKIELLASE